MRKSESGRSMVEMLGVLTIIGVLSVGGIIGLRQALTNARANDLIYEANKRATVVSGQLMFSNGTPSLSEFAQNEFSFGTFNSVTPQNGTFTISINGVSEAVCAKAQSMASGMIVSFTPQACSGDDNTVQLTYNNDLSEGESAASGGSSGGSTHAPTKWDGPLTGDGSTCAGTPKGECQVCINGSYIDSDAICLNQGKNICVDGICQGNNIGCLNNGDCLTLNPTQCGNGECYCNFAGNVDTCTGPKTTGKCILTSQSFYGQVSVEGHNYVLGEYSVSQVGLDWFSAKNFCAASGKRMMTMTEFGCENVTNCTDTNTIYGKICAVAPNQKMGSWTSDILNNCYARYIRAKKEITSYSRANTERAVICY